MRGPGWKKTHLCVKNCPTLKLVLKTPKQMRGVEHSSSSSTRSSSDLYRIVDTNPDYFTAEQLRMWFTQIWQQKRKTYL